MIDVVELKNFYSHKDTELKLKKFNIFIGRNGSGKSSIFKAITHIKQFLLGDFDIYTNNQFQPMNYINDVQSLIFNYNKNNKNTFPATFNIIGNMNGTYIQNQETPIQYKLGLDINSKLEIKIISKLKNRNENFIMNESTSRKIKLNPKSTFAFDSYLEIVDGNNNIEIKEIFSNIQNNKIEDFNNIMKSKKLSSIELNRPNIFYEIVNHFLYINPLARELYTSTYELQPNSLSLNNKILLENTKLVDIYSTLLYEKETLFPFINESLKKIFNDEYQIDITLNPGRIIIPKLKIKENNFDISNLASGIQVILDLIIRILLAPENSSIFIDEPEIHIDVNKQGQLLKVLFDLCNIRHNQLIIATHSEHILNALSALVKKGEYTPDQINVFHFSLDDYTKIKKIEFNENFALKSLPDFDECIEKEFQNSYVDKDKIKI